MGSPSGEVGEVEVKRVYMADGTVAHVVTMFTERESLCGRTPWPGHWLGGGGLAQQERASELPLCVACGQVLRHRQGKVGGR